MDKGISVFYVKNWQRRGTSAFFHNDEKSMMKILLYPYDNGNIDFVARGLDFFKQLYLWGLFVDVRTIHKLFLLDSEPIHV